MSVSDFLPLVPVVIPFGAQLLKKYVPKEYAPVVVAVLSVLVTLAAHYLSPDAVGFVRQLVEGLVYAFAGVGLYEVNKHRKEKAAGDA